MPGNNSEVGSPSHFSPGNKVLRLQAQGLPPHQSGIAGPEYSHHNNNHCLKARPQSNRQHQGQQYARYGEKYIHRPHDQVVYVSPKVPSYQPQGSTNDSSDSDGYYRHRQGDPGAVDNPAQDISALFIGTQGVLPDPGLRQHHSIDFLTANPNYLVLFLSGQYYSTGDPAYDPSIPWANPKTGKLVRQAMNKAINRDELLQFVLRGSGKPMYNTAFHPSLEGWNPK